MTAWRWFWARWWLAYGLAPVGIVLLAMHLTGTPIGPALGKAAGWLGQVATDTDRMWRRMGL